MEEALVGIHRLVRSKVDENENNKREIVEDRVLKSIETMETKRNEEKELTGCVQDAV